MGSNCYFLMSLANLVNPMLHIIRYRVEYGIETQIKNGEKSLRISMALGKQRNQFQIKLLFIFIDFMFYVYI